MISQRLGDTVLLFYPHDYQPSYLPFIQLNDNCVESEGFEPSSKQAAKIDTIEITLQTYKCFLD